MLGMDSIVGRKTYHVNCARVTLIDFPTKYPEVEAVLEQKITKDAKKKERART